MIGLSNQNWARVDIGNTNNTLFACGYIIVPFVMVLTCGYTIFSKSFRDRIGLEKWMLLMLLNLSYFCNYSRGLVRHSLNEEATTVVFWCAYLFLALFISFYINNIKLFMPSFMILILINVLFIQDENFSEKSIADKTVSCPEAIIESWKPARFCDEENNIIAKDGSIFKTEWERIKYEQDNVNRVVLSETLSNYVAKYEYVLNEILKDDETFVDFMNKTLLYSVMGKRCPVYVSQSPLQLSGEFTQKEFIKEITGVPIVLMPIDADNFMKSNSFDVVANAYRYYKVYEYIYQNYKPLCRCGNDYAVWCLPERYNEYRTIVKGLENKNTSQTEEIVVSMIDYGYDGPNENIDDENNVDYEYISVLHNIFLFHLPRIWAEYDKDKAINNSILCELTNNGNIYTFDLDSFEREENGNYLKISAIYDGLDADGMIEENDETSDATVIFGQYTDDKFVEKYKYTFNISEGEHNYLIRCSTDYYWYLGEINAVKIDTGSNLRNISMQILEGD